MNKVYVLIKVEYDYFRFQDFCGVFNDLDDVFDYMNKIDPDIPIYSYIGNKHEDHDRNENHHWQIREEKIR